MTDALEPIPPGAPRRIVVRGVNWLGDAVMTTPALCRLRERFPDAEITLLTPSKLKDLWTGHPDVHQVLPIGVGEGVLSVARRLRRGRFDLAVLLPNSPRTGVEAWLGGIPRRVGGSWPWRNALLTDIVPPAPEVLPMRKRSPEEIRKLIAGAPSPVSARSSGPASGTRSHQMFHYLRLVSYLGANPEPAAPRLYVTPAEIESVRQKFGFQPGSQWLGINPGAEYGAAKRWPLERFAAAAVAVHEQCGCGIAVFGGLADIGLAESLSAELATAAPTVRILAGRTSLRELLAALTLCRVVLTNDTGPMHAAAAVGVPVVVPFGSTSPELTAPGLPGDPRHQLLRAGAPCAPCFLREC
ncbi:MAG: lipopolysaccharide heptosyltransferase II, partial [Verrucomicrobia bacterium]|nr:lipopolysaccharide heptosyltransferase II [Verrucomicrobiota bacterium]